VYQPEGSRPLPLVQATELVTENGHDPVGDRFFEHVELPLDFPAVTIVSDHGLQDVRDLDACVCCNCVIMKPDLAGDLDRSRPKAKADIHHERKYACSNGSRRGKPCPSSRDSSSTELGSQTECESGQLNSHCTSVATYSPRPWEKSKAAGSRADRYLAAHCLPISGRLDRVGRVRRSAGPPRRAALRAVPRQRPRPAAWSRGVPGRLSNEATNTAGLARNFGGLGSRHLVIRPLGR
jgi:hypothetical protein